MELNRLAPEAARGFISSQQTTAAAASPAKSGSAVPYTEPARRPEATTGAAPIPATRRDTSDESATANHITSLLDPLDEEPIEEIDPVDYLEAEVRKVDQHLAQELMYDEDATLFSHIVSTLADLVTVAITSAPFLGLIVLTNGSLSDRSTLLGAGILVVLLTGFYLFLTQSLSGKTFGMMLTNTRVIDAATGKRLSVQRAMVRSLFYPIALAPAGIGILWAAIDRRHRCWQDLLSGTVVVRDF
jgi:uncharacterized RDD family membrane protein YckC